VLDAMGDGTRRAIVELLAERPRAVIDLAGQLPVSRPAVSLHLRVLREAGLVRDTAVGTRRIYELDPEGLAMLRTYLDLLWTRALDNFAKAAEAAHEKKHPKGTSHG
jgi:DNA-binding transcriptional ArsR family regulator